MPTSQQVTGKMQPLTEHKKLLKERRICLYVLCFCSSHGERVCHTTKMQRLRSHASRHHRLTRTVSHGRATYRTTKPFHSRDSRCTEVCRDGLVQVFNWGERKCAVKMYALLDDQSNRLLAGSEFFWLFCFHGSPVPYLMRTCAGNTEMVGRKAVQTTSREKQSTVKCVWICPRSLSTMRLWAFETHNPLLSQSLIPKHTFSFY